MSARHRHDSYTVGWICALPTETAAAVGMLDDLHDMLPQNPQDYNSYSLGRIGAHNVVVACLPAGVMGVTSAARVATQMRTTFTSVRFALMVGIGGGVPGTEHDVRLGDVVVSKPEGTLGGVIQYDYGKTVQEGRFVRTGSLNRPPDVLLNAVANLDAHHRVSGPQILRFLSEMSTRYPPLRATATPPEAEQDELFEAEYDHPKDQPTCDKCDRNRLVARPGRSA